MSRGTVVATPVTSRLEVSGLQKHYGSRKVVQDVHLAVGAGEVVGLLGPNGAGKTTTFYMVVGLVRAVIAPRAVTEAASAASNGLKTSPSLGDRR